VDAGKSTHPDSKSVVANNPERKNATRHYPSARAKGRNPFSRTKGRNMSDVNDSSHYRKDFDRNDLIAAARKLWGTETSRPTRTEWRFGSHGSKSIKLDDLVWHDHETSEGGGVAELMKRAGINGAGTHHQEQREQEKPNIYYSYKDENGDELFQVVRQPGHKFLQRHQLPDGTWTWNVKGVRRVLYRLPELTRSANTITVFIVEGEKDAINLAALGTVTTTNPGGAGKWRNEYSEFLRDRIVVILPDNDAPGHAHANQVAAALAGVARSVKVLDLPGLGPKQDVSDWIKRGGTLTALEALVNEEPTARPAADDEPTPGVRRSATNELPAHITREDFYAIMPQNLYAYIPTREPWQATAIDKRLGKKTSTWICQNRGVEQITWAPGEPQIIVGKIVAEGGFIEAPNNRIFNQYLPPNPNGGDPSQARPWLDHIKRIYPDDASHIICWFAHCVQFQNIKINHALVLGGNMGIGKDTIIEPVIHAIGHWNSHEVSPQDMLGKFNGYLKHTLLRINEARDLGESDRFKFYDHMKTLLATPPFAIRINEKNLKEYMIPNFINVIITTNYKADGIHLSHDDRRHYVAWSQAVKKDFPDEYWNELWGWYAQRRDGCCGLDHVGAYLRTFDLEGYNPKAPPPHTRAFLDIADASRAPEDAELADAIDRLGSPDALTTGDLFLMAQGDLLEWLRDRKNRRAIPHRLEKAGYVPVRNDTRNDGLWIIGGERKVIYAKTSLSIRDQIAAARKRISEREQ
jgi:hypothetical protein